MYQGLRLWRRARGAVGQVVHGYRLMPLAGQVYHGVFPRPKNASPKRFLNGLSNPLHKKIKLTPRGISFISGGAVKVATDLSGVNSAHHFAIHIGKQGQLYPLSAGKIEFNGSDISKDKNL